MRVLKGAIYDVAVDIRTGSATYGRWVGARLDADIGAQLLVPRGFAHGYCTLEPDTMLAYKVDGPYAPDCEGGVLWCDPALGIDWPIAPEAAVANDRDRKLPRLADLEPVDF